MKVDKFFKGVDEDIIGFCYYPVDDSLASVYTIKCGGIDYIAVENHNHKELIQYFRTMARLNGDRQEGDMWVEHWLTRSGKYRRYAIRGDFAMYRKYLKEFFLDESR